PTRRAQGLQTFAPRLPSPEDFLEQRRSGSRIMAVAHGDLREKPTSAGLSQLLRRRARRYALGSLNARLRSVLTAMAALLMISVAARGPLVAGRPTARVLAENVGRENDCRGGAVESKTSATLLGRLQQVPADQAAWAQFTERYGRKIYAWCRRWNLQGADVEDLTQDVLLKLAEKMQTFVYDPAKSFRAWLKTVVRHAWSDSCSG